MSLGRTIGFLGTGNMAEALIKGILAAGLTTPSEIIGSDPRQLPRMRRRWIRARYGIRTTQSNLEVVRTADLVFLSVKPQIIDRVCREVAPELKPQARSSSPSPPPARPPWPSRPTCPDGTHLVRSMPNTPALVGAGATAIAPGNLATEDDVALVRRVFEAVGMAVVLEGSQLDAVTGLSGSGPAYVFLIIEAFSDAGVKMGLSRYAAMQLAAQTVLGSAKLLLETGEHPGRLKDMVTSPGGTAIAGLHTLEAGGLRTTLINAVQAATERSRALGEIAAEARRKAGL